MPNPVDTENASESIDFAKVLACDRSRVSPFCPTAIAGYFLMSVFDDLVPLGNSPNPPFQLSLRRVASAASAENQPLLPECDGLAPRWPGSRWGLGAASR